MISLSHCKAPRALFWLSQGLDRAKSAFSDPYGVCDSEEEEALFFSLHPSLKIELSSRLVHLFFGCVGDEGNSR